MPEGHDAAELPQHRAPLLTRHVLGVHRLRDQQELRRQRRLVPRRGCPFHAGPVVELLGERVGVGLLRDHPPQGVEAPALLRIHVRHLRPTLEEDEDIMARHAHLPLLFDGLGLFDVLDEDAAPLGVFVRVPLVVPLDVVLRVPIDVFLRDARPRPSD